MKRTSDALAVAAHLFLALYLAMLLAAPRTQSALAALTALAAIAAALTGRAGAGRGRPATALPMAVLLVPAAVWGLIVFIQIVTGDAAVKFGNQVIVIGCIVAIGLSRVPWALPDARRSLLPAAAVGALGAGGLALWQSLVDDIARPHGWLGAGALGTGAIKFGDLSALLALLSLVLVLTARGWRYGLGLAGIASGLFALALSQARGGLLGVLVAIGALGLALTLAALRRRRSLLAGAPGGSKPASAVPPRPSGGRSPAAGVPLHARRGLRVATLAVLLVVATAASMQHRFADIEPQLERFQRGDALSETGQRLALWQAALRSGLHAPWIGVGLGRFGADLERQAAAGQIAPSTQILYRQPHNEYLAGFAAAGIPGLVAIVALFWLPVVALIRRIAGGADSPEARAALVTSAAFAGFALTDSMFDRQITVIAFFLLTTWFLRMAVRPDGRGATLARSAAAQPAVASTPALAPTPAQPARTPARPAPMPAWIGAGSRAGPHVGPYVGPHAAPRLSVAVITKNEGHRIVRCLQSVSFADQIVVVDSGSEDDTVALARRCGAEVAVTDDWPGFGVQKNRALAACTAPWVLSIDADEVVSDELRRAIEAVIDGPAQAAANGYWLTRSSRFCGQTMRFGNWRNDRVLRLFRRAGSRFSDDLVHERVLCAPPLGELRGTLEHDSVDSLEDAREKTIRYARAGAVQLRNRGRGGRFSAWTHAGWSFVRGYLLRLGFLDGRHGFTLALLNSQGTYWRYLWAAQPDADSGGEPGLAKSPRNGNP